MKTVETHINILGLGSQSTLFYLETLNKLYYKRLGDYHTFPCIIYNIDFNNINPFLPNQFEQLVPRLQYYLDKMDSTTNGYLIIPNITLHETMDKCSCNLKCIHPIQLAADYIKINSVSKITIFGSKYTMESSYITSILEPLKIEISVPEEQDTILIDAIRKKIYAQNITDKDLATYNNLINKYTADYYILIACTELSIINNNYPNPKTIDLAILQIQSAIDKIININIKH